MRCSAHVRVGIVAESFLPHVNGVTNSILRVLEHLQRKRIPAVVLAPSYGATEGPDEYAGAPVVRLRSAPMPGYPQVRVNLTGSRRMGTILDEHGVDVVHLASPFLVGPPAIRAARRRGMPTVAVYQTDMAGFATRYGAAFASQWMWRRLRATHQHAHRTLAPSKAAIADLRREGVPRVRLWQRGIDAQRFHPSHRDEHLRSQLAPRGEVLVGFLGRLAAEKQVEDLRVLADLPGIRLVIIGDGPRRASLERALPGATFLGFLNGQALSRAVASLDIAVNTGPHETFCQSVQEALASGVPVVSVASGGPLDLVDHSRTGWLYSRGNLDELRDRVRDLAGDRAKAAAMGQQARRSVEGRTWERVGDLLLQHYREVQGHLVDTEFRRAA